MKPYTNSVAIVLGTARIEARAGRAAGVGPEHLFLGLAKLCRKDLGRVLDAAGLTPAHREAVETNARAVRRRFELAGVDPHPFRRRLRAALAAGAPADLSAPAPDAVPPRDRAARRVFVRAAELAGSGAFGAVDLLRAVLESPMPGAAELFAELGVDDPLAAFFPRHPGRPPGAGPGKPEGPGAARGPQDPRKPPEPDRPPREPREEAPPRRPRAPRREAGETPFLDRYGRDLTRLAREGRLPELIGRREELRALAQALVRQRKANAVLVGDAGVGKTNIVEGLAVRLAGPGAPAGLAGARVVELSMASLVAGAAYRGDFEARLESVLAEARRTPGLILFIDELHTVLGAGGKGASDAANILKPALARGDLRCVGATTPGEYRRYVEADPALQRRFGVIWVDEPGRAEAVEILQRLLGSTARHHGVEIDADVPSAAVDLTIRHLPELRLPDKAIDAVDQACAAARVRTLSPVPGTDGPIRVGRHEVAAAVAARARIPLERVAVHEAQRLLSMEERLRRRVIGQDEAVGAVAEAVRVARAGLGDPRRPVGVFLFAGPTGTGKTELAKALAEFLFDDERRLIRIDMSEYKERHSLSRLLGAPPGYIGHEREGRLSGPLRDHPHSVVLFDEVEKAHPEVLDIFLQIFDEGRLTDSHGRLVPFTESVVILTSNLGATTSVRPGPMGFAPAVPPDAGAAAARSADVDRVRSALAKELRPELLGRIGRVVVFEPLTRASLDRILDKLIDRVRDRLAARSITVSLTGDARELLLRQATGASSGVRALEAAVERLLVQPLGHAILSDRFGDGAEVRVDADGDVLGLAVGRPPTGSHDPRRGDTAR
ncbi:MULTISPECIES: ATP-dependent Clp protease ATP-binding subunit [unclassified Streptomyces]|uniref:ATP-dependent Clp protease ATP-binding subunit n=1 Tax=unclassified Streptomyces TaxID=2593676 RepID=UPI003321539F